MARSSAPTSFVDPTEALVLMLDLSVLLSIVRLTPAFAARRSRDHPSSFRAAQMRAPVITVRPDVEVGIVDAGREVVERAPGWGDQRKRRQPHAKGFPSTCYSHWGTIELLARVTGELQETTQVNVLVSPEYLELRTIILRTLAPYPEARVAIASALRNVDHAGA